MVMEKPPIPNSYCKPLTTFVQTNTDAFREVVQRLTGPSESPASKELEPSTTTKVVAANVKKPTSKLHERRKYMKPKLEIVKPSFSTKSSASLSPSMSRNSSYPASPASGGSSYLASPITPSGIFSQLSLLDDEMKEDSAVAELNTEEEEKAIKERRFYLHPSPRSKPGFTEPELLPLFPIASVDTSENV